MQELRSMSDENFTHLKSATSVLHARSSPVLFLNETCERLQTPVSSRGLESFRRNYKDEKKVPILHSRVLNSDYSAREVFGTSDVSIRRTHRCEELTRPPRERHGVVTAGLELTHGHPLPLDSVRARHISWIRFRSVTGRVAPSHCRTINHR